MKDQDLDEFSWSGLFFVTCICSFVFFGIIKLLDGSNSTLFRSIGLVAFVLWLLNRASEPMMKKGPKQVRARSNLSNNFD